MGAGCSRCNVGLPCVDPECPSPATMTVSNNLTTRLKDATKEDRIEEKWRQKLNRLHSDYIKERGLTSENFGNLARNIHSFYRPRQTMDEYVPARNRVISCYDGRDEDFTVCYESVMDLDEVATAGVDKPKQSPPRTGKCVLKNAGRW